MAHETQQNDRTQNARSELSNVSVSAANSALTYTYLCVFVLWAMGQVGNIGTTELNNVFHAFWDALRDDIDSCLHLTLYLRRLAEATSTGQSDTRSRILAHIELMSQPVHCDVATPFMSMLLGGSVSTLNAMIELADTAALQDAEHDSDAMSYSIAEGGDSELAETAALQDAEHDSDAMSYSITVGHGSGEMSESTSIADASDMSGISDANSSNSDRSMTGV